MGTYVRLLKGGIELASQKVQESNSERDKAVKELSEIVKDIGYWKKM